MLTKGKTRIVVLGAGFAGAYTFRYLHRLFHKDSSVELVLVNRTNYFLFTPLLHEIATGGTSPDNIVESLPRLVSCCNSDFYEGEVRRINTREHVVESSTGRILYDYLVLALGSQTNFFGIPGAAEYSYDLKTFEDAVLLKNHFIEVFEKASDTADERVRSELLHFVVIGGGPTGVELAAEMSDLFYKTLSRLYRRYHLEPYIRIDLIHRGVCLLPKFSQAVRHKAAFVLKSQRVNVMLNTIVNEVGEKYLLYNGGKRIDAGTIIWTAGVKPAEVPFDVEVPRHESGKLIVDSTLQLKGKQGIFGIGDMAYFEDRHGHALPALAQVATQQGRFLAHNIYRMVKREKPLLFHYHHSGDLVSLGRWMAVAEIYGFRTLGHFAWWLWRTVYLFKIISWRKRIKVAIDWTINLFSERDISKLG
jgi:NADH dehydrogenase